MRFETEASAFRGAPPVDELANGKFPDVRHVEVPVWSETEFARLLEKVPALADPMTGAPERFRDVARVPFNTRLLGDLVKDRRVTEDLSRVSSQAAECGCPGWSSRSSATVPEPWPIMSRG